MSEDRHPLGHCPLAVGPDLFCGAPIMKVEEGVGFCEAGHTIFEAEAIKCSPEVCGEDDGD